MANRLSLLREKHVAFWGDKQVHLIGGQTCCPYRGTNRLSLFGDKQVALIGGQTCCPYWGINRLPLLGDKQVALIGGQTSRPYWGTNNLPYWETNKLPYWETYRLPLLVPFFRDKWVFLFQGQVSWPFTFNFILKYVFIEIIIYTFVLKESMDVIVSFLQTRYTRCLFYSDLFSYMLTWIEHVHVLVSVFMPLHVRFATMMTFCFEA